MTLAMTGAAVEGNRHAISDTLDVFDVRRAARLLAAGAGFDRIEQEEVTIIVSELASNIVKHGVRGWVRLERVRSSDGRPGIRVVARDHGAVIERLQPGWTMPVSAELVIRRIGSGGIGGGIDAVRRLTDSLTYRRDDAGNEIAVVRYQRRRPRPR